ncbi:phosphotransferase [Paraburkholderia sediminicola]|uniref:phosphotransferase n=1 Tax=Paraburkholderia sediminicola TaxID=458836 RepID=UPI0038BC9D76
MMDDVERLELLLMMHWDIRPTRIQALSTGHTNKTYRVDYGSRAAVLRVSWPGKPAEQVRREASMLDRLGSSPQLPTLPRFQSTVNAQPCAQVDDGSWLHLFEHIEGTPGLPADAEPAIVDAMYTLARLHAAMATMSASVSDPLAWLNERYARVSARPAPPLPAILLEHYDLLLRRIGMHFAAAAAWIRGPASWLHGDYHAGNLLFANGTVTGVLDFDDVGQGAHWLEAAFALFALSRDATHDDRFTFDVRLWDAGLRAYAAIQPDDASDMMHLKRDALVDLFCADQSLIHLEAAQRGLWMPGPGMGFLACWRQLLASPPPIPVL